MKKVLALVLALMMVFSLSVTAFGDGKAPEEYSDEPERRPDFALPLRP